MMIHVMFKVRPGPISGGGYDPVPILQKYNRSGKVTISADIEYLVEGEEEVIKELKKELKKAGCPYYEYVGEGRGISMAWNLD